MKVLVISPENADPREPAVLAELIDAGLQRYHVRKPSWSALELEQWILFLPEWCRRFLVLHQHHHLVAKLGLGGIHNPKSEVSAEIGNRQSAIGNSKPSLSRSCHTLEELSASIGRYDYAFFGPVFPSISKAAYGPGKFDSAALSALLQNRPSTRTSATPAAGRATELFAIGGITGETAPRCRELGFDGIATLGALWHSSHPVREYFRIAKAVAAPRPVARAAVLPTVMCLTQDGLPLSHVEQARQLCSAGAKLIQLRMKSASPAEWLDTARAVVAICRAAGAVCIVNDSVEIALASGAHGVHLGREDGDWVDARQRGPRLVIGGTVNNGEDARRARAAGCLDYVGIGPFRFTTTKAKLAPVLGADGIRQLVAELGDLPAWVIGGVVPADAPLIRQTGAAGVAVSSSLFRDGNIAANFREFSLK